MGGWTQPLAGSQPSKVQAFPSEQASGAWVQPIAGSQASTVQASASAQARGVPGWQVPAMHTSTPLQALGRDLILLALAVAVYRQHERYNRPQQES